MLATKKQLTYLQSLTDKAEVVRRRHPSLVPLGLYHTVWGMGMTSEKASLRIQFYESILDRADRAMHPTTKNDKNL